jgi:hypothetical protein
MYQYVMRKVTLLLTSGTFVGLSARAQSALPPPISALPEANAPAFVAAVRLNAFELSSLPRPADGGTWLVEDSMGTLISSGVLRVFPSAITSVDYGAIVPGAAKRSRIAFGFARSPVVDGNGPFRVVFVVVRSTPQRPTTSHSHIKNRSGNEQTDEARRLRLALLLYA